MWTSLPGDWAQEWQLDQCREGTEQGEATGMVASGDQNGSRWGDWNGGLGEQNWSRCGGPELEPAWDLICTQREKQCSRGKKGGAKSEAQQNRIDGHPEEEQEDHAEAAWMNV